VTAASHKVITNLLETVLDVAQKRGNSVECVRKVSDPSLQPGRVAERRALQDIVSKAARVVAVFNGHVHWNHFDVISGVPYITLQSLVENLDEDAPGRAAAAHAVVDLDEQRMVVRVAGAEPVRYQVEHRGRG